MPATRGLINAAAFAKMKKGAFIINTARGPLIDEPALIAALDSGHLGGAALDVVTTEPLAKDSPLIGRDNVILTPHTAFYSVEALTSCRPNARPTSRACCPARSRSIRSRRNGHFSRSQITITFTTLLLTFGCGIGGLSMNSRSPSKRMKRICSPPTQASFQAISTLVMTRPFSTR